MLILPQNLKHYNIGNHPIKHDLIRVDNYVYKRLEEIVEESKELGMTKSECGYAILKMFYKVN